MKYLSGNIISKIENSSDLGFPGKWKRVYVKFIYSVTIIGHQETGAEATKLHTSSCDKNRDKLWSGRVNSVVGLTLTDLNMQFSVCYFKIFMSVMGWTAAISCSYKNSLEDFTVHVPDCPANLTLIPWRKRVRRVGF